MSTHDETMARMERFHALWRSHTALGLPKNQGELDRIAAACGVTAPRLPRIIRIPRRPARPVSGTTG